MGTSAKGKPAREKGFSLIETLIALAILGITAVGILSGLGLGTQVTMNTREREAARDLAVAQMEYIKHSPYQDMPYNINPGLDLGGHSMTVAVDPIDDFEQKVTISVSYKLRKAEEMDSRVFVLEGYKGNR